MPHSSQPSSDSNRLEELLEALFLRQLTDVEITELEDLLQQDEGARLQYLKSARLFVDLKKWGQGQGLAEQVVASALSQANVRQNPFSEGVSVRRVRIWALAAVACLVLMALGWWIFWEGSNTTNPIAKGTPPKQNAGEAEEPRLAHSRNVVARITAVTPDVIWSEFRPQDFLLRIRSNERVGLEKGKVEINFIGGATMTLIGPAQVLVESSSALSLESGKLFGRAENGNFTVSTTAARVVDIGTEFGVQRFADGRTDVKVFEGEVHVLPTGNADQDASIDQASHRLTDGMSISLRADGEIAQQASMHAAENSDVMPGKGKANESGVSLLDLLCGGIGDTKEMAGSLDPRTGHWGQLTSGEQGKWVAGNTQFIRTDWNSVIDGVFVPRMDGRAMQIDSAGHVVFLPENTGRTWGPIWARRSLDAHISHGTLFLFHEYDFWGNGTLKYVTDRLRDSAEGILGIHANVGMTLDLHALAAVHQRETVALRTTVANLHEIDKSRPSPHADLRIYIDGKLRFSRLGFSTADGEMSVAVELFPEDRFLTIVATDGGDGTDFDRIVLIDPVIDFAAFD